MSRIELVKADITKIKADAIVNAAKTTLLGGSGVDGAIHRAGGPLIIEDCRKIRARNGGCPPGEAVITRAGNLPSRYVIHAVGPVWKGGEENEAQTLKNAYSNALALTEPYGLESIAFPNISTGIYSFPKELAAEIAIDTVKDYLGGNFHLKKVIFVCYDKENYGIYEILLDL